jgi:hypothetical protein
MNKIEMLKNIETLRAKNAKNIELISTKKDEILNATTLDVAESLDKEIESLTLENKQNEIKISQLEAEMATKTKEKKGENAVDTLEKLLSSKDYEKSFVNALTTSDSQEKFKSNLKRVVAENGITFDDDDNLMPKRMIESILTNLTDDDGIFKLFRVTHVGALIVSRDLTSSDKALVHVDGANKTEQAAVLTVSTLEPFMIYKMQSIAERVRRVTSNIEEIINLLIAEMTQAIVNKIVDLALVTGNSAGTSTVKAFESIMNETNVLTVKHIAGTTDLLADVENAVNFVKGTKYLIVTETQRHDLLTAIREKSTNVYIKNDDKEIASFVGANGLVTYTGTEALDITVLAQGAYHVDMDDLTRVEAFKWETNTNIYLLETLAAGHLDTKKGAATVIPYVEPNE